MLQKRCFCLSNYSKDFNKKCIREALLKLMNQKDFKDIFVTEITKLSGVSRMSYYRYYTYKEDILNEYIDDILKAYTKKRNESKDDIYNRILFGFETFYQYKDFVLSMEKNNLSGMIQNKINEYIKIFYPNSATDIKEKYHLHILMGSIYNTAKMWLIEDKGETPKEITDIVYNRLFY